MTKEFVLGTGVIALAGTALLSLSACATIVSGTGQSVTVVTEKGVDGAKCELTDKKGGKWYIPDTPGTATVRKGDGPLSVVCKKKGYKTAVLNVEETIAGATFGNIILGGGIGILVDAASGAAQHYPDQIVVWMEPEQWNTEEERVVWRKEKEQFEETIKKQNENTPPSSEN